MKNLSTYLVVMFMIMYWIFRVVLAVTNTVGVDLGITIPNYNMEIALLFITIVSIVLVIKRNIIGGSSKHPGQIFRQNIFTGSLSSCEQQIRPLEQRCHGHLQNFFPIERNLRFRDPVSYCLVNRILFSECFHLLDEHRGYFLFL